MNELKTTQETSLNSADHSSAQRDIMTAYKLTGEAKIKGILDFIATLLENEIKFIFFAFHLSVLSAVQEYLVKNKVYSIRIDGSVPMGKRCLLVKEFQNSSKCRAAILGITASSQGITLTAASTVVFGELTWTPGVMEQAEDRAHRIKQKCSVTVYYLMAKRTLDSLIYRILKTKNENTARVLDGKSADYHTDPVEENKTKVESSPRGTLEHYFPFKKTTEPEKSMMEEPSKKEQIELMEIFNLGSDTKFPAEESSPNPKRKPNAISQSSGVSPKRKLIKDY